LSILSSLYFLFFLFLVVFLAIAAFPFLKNKFKRYNKGDEEIPVDSEDQTNN